MKKKNEKLNFIKIPTAENGGEKKTHQSDYAFERRQQQQKSLHFVSKRRCNITALEQMNEWAKKLE